MSTSIRRAGVAVALGALAAAALSAGAAPVSASTSAPAGAAPSRNAVNSSPPDRTIYSRTGAPARAVRPATPAGINVVDPSLVANSFSGTEPSIAVNPSNPNQIAITRFTFLWNNNADLLYSTDGGISWTEEATIPAPPNVPGSAGCPCDQTIDFGRDGRLYGSFLVESSPSVVVTGSTTDPTSAAAWSWNGNPAQLTNAAGTNADQPWLLVNRDPTTASQDDAYVGYDDFNAGPTARVAVSRGSNPVNIVTDSPAGTESPLSTNPGLRLGADHGTGTMYAMYEQSTGGPPQSVTYKLNRSTDSGRTWTLGGSTDGITLDTVNSDQAPGFKFGTVNALLGGVDHVTVDPTNGDVYVVYGQDVAGGNRILLRRLQSDGAGGLTVGPASVVSTTNDTALPSVAVASDGTIGVLYDSFDGIVGGLPTFSAHLARSTDHGVTFGDSVLESFSSPSADDGDGRQRVLGDYQQIKAVGTTFYGVFSGNRNVFGGTASIIDPIFFSAAPSGNQTATTTTVSSLANPSGLAQAVSFTATVSPVPDGGSVAFSVDGRPFGAPVPVSTTTGRATSGTVGSLGPGSHTVVASYLGDAHFGSSRGQLIQAVTCANTITGSVAGNVTIGRPTCITGATINGTVTVQAGAPVAVNGGSIINGAFTASQAAEVLLCGNTFNSTVSVSGSSGAVRVGDGGDDGSATCTGSTIHGLTLTSNRGGAEVGSNTVFGNVAVNGTTGTESPLEGGAPEVEANSIQGSLACSGNSPAPVNDGLPNFVSGTRSGQCGAAGF